VDFLEGSNLVDEETPLPVRTEVLFMELLAHLRLVLLVLGRIFLNELHISMRELALGAVPATALLNPVLAHLSLVLSLVNFKSRLLRDGRILLGLFGVGLVIGFAGTEVGGCLNLTALLLLHLDLSRINASPAILATRVFLHINILDPWEIGDVLKRLSLVSC
jgi:hypothetical protein